MPPIVRLPRSRTFLAQPITRQMDESQPARRLPSPPARSSCGSTSSRWPSLAAVAWALVTHGDAAARRRRTCPWWAVALGFAGRRDLRRPRPLPPQRALLLARRPAVRLRPRVRRRRRFVLGALVGTGIVCGLIRRLRARQARSSTSPSSRSPRALAAAILQLVAGDADALQPETWIGLYAATLASGALTILLLGGAIAIAEGDVSPPTLVQMFATDALVTLINASIAIAAALVVATDPRAVPVLLVPALTVFAVYRAYISERQRHERLEFLYDANRTLSPLARGRRGARGAARPLARGLPRRRRRGRCSSPRDGDPLRTTHGPGDQRVTMEPADRAIAEELAGLVDAEHPVVSLTPPFGSPHLRAHMQARGIRHAMIAMLPGEERTIGTIMLANRVGLERSFGADDLRLLEALANNAAVALQYDRLEQAVNKLQSLQDQLHHQAYHDPLTDLPNRTLFMERVRDELGRRRRRPPSCSSTSTTSRPSTTRSAITSATRCCVSVAERLRGCVRPEDTVARLGGDEFAVMIPGVDDPLADGRAVARRDPEGVRAARRGRHRAGLRAPLSVGLALSSQTGGDGDELIRNADVAMYQAKSKGKARFELFEPQMAAADPAPPRLQGRAGQGDRARADDRPVPADRRAGLGPDRRRRGARALGASRARPRPARRVRAAGRGDRADRAARPPRPARGLPRRPAAGRTPRPTPSVEPLRMHVNLSVAELRDPDLVDNVLASIAGVRHRPEPARDRDHRVPAARRRRRGALPRAARARRQDRARRLRHRLLVAVATCTRCRWTR